MLILGTVTELESARKGVSGGGMVPVLADFGIPLPQQPIIEENGHVVELGRN